MPHGHGSTLLVSALALFAVLSLAYVGSISLRASWAESITGDEPFYLLTTQSLLQDGDLDLTQQYQLRSYQAFFNHPDGLWQQSVRLDNGILLSPHNPGLSVLLIPGFGLGGLLGAQTQLLILAALTFALTYVLIARNTGEYLWSWLAAAIVGLSANAFVYATEIYPEMPAALLLITSLLLVQSKSSNSAMRTLLLVSLLSAMVWLGIKYSPLAALVALWAMWQLDARPRAALLLAGGVSAGIFVWFHLMTFGSLTPYSVGVVYAGDPTLAVLGQHLGISDRAYRLIGLVIDQRFGIGRWAPVLLIAIPGMALLWRGGSSTKLVLTLIVTQLLIATFLAITMMGWWFPGRTMITVLPLFALPLALLLIRLPKWGRAAVGLLAAYTLAITAALVIAGHNGEIAIAVDPFDMKAFLFQVVSPIFPDYRSWTVQTYLLTGGWLSAAVCAVALVSNLPQFVSSQLRRHALVSNGRNWVFHYAGILPQMVVNVPLS